MRISPTVAGAVVVGFVTFVGVVVFAFSGGDDSSSGAPAPAPGSSTTPGIGPSGPPAEPSAGSSPSAADGAVPNVCKMIGWSDLPQAMRPARPRDGQIENMVSSQYPAACQWRVYAADGTLKVQVNAGFQPGPFGTVAADATPVTVKGHQASTHEAAWGSGEPYCQGGLALPELSGSLEVLLTNANVPAVSVCDALVSTYTGVVGNV